MITEMKKYTFLVLTSAYEHFLTELREAGVVHITPKAEEGAVSILRQPLQNAYGMAASQGASKPPARKRTGRVPCYRQGLECVSKVEDVQFRGYQAAFQGAFPKAYWLQVEEKQHRNAA